MKPFFCVQNGALFIATTAYTAEVSYEIAMPKEQPASFWQLLVATDVKPTGFGAPRTLRLEASINLYGQDMDEGISSLVANMGWVIVWIPEDCQFICRAALEQQRELSSKQLVSLMMTQKYTTPWAASAFHRRSGADTLRGDHQSFVLSDFRFHYPLPARAYGCQRAGYRADPQS